MTDAERVDAYIRRWAPGALTRGRPEMARTELLALVAAVRLETTKRDGRVAELLGRPDIEREILGLPRDPAAGELLEDRYRRLAAIAARWGGAMIEATRTGRVAPLDMRDVDQVRALVASAPDPTA